MHRQRIHQFIGKEAACHDVRRNCSRTREAPSGRVALRVFRGLFAPRGRMLYSDIAQRLIKCCELGFAKIEHLASKPPHTRARLNKHKFRRAVEMSPHLRELSRQETGKDGMHVDTCVVVGETLGLRFAVIAVDRMVEAFAHVVRERKRAEAANAVGK